MRKKNITKDRRKKRDEKYKNLTKQKIRNKREKDEKKKK